MTSLYGSDRQGLGASATPSGSRPTGQAPAGLDATRFDPSRMSDEQLRAKLNDEFRQMGCPYRIGDERLDAWQEGYRAGLRFAMGATS